MTNQTAGTDLDIRYLPANSAWCLCWRDGQITDFAGKRFWGSRDELAQALDFEDYADFCRFAQDNFNE